MLSKNKLKGKYSLNSQPRTIRPNSSSGPFHHIRANNHHNNISNNNIKTRSNNPRYSSKLKPSASCFPILTNKNINYHSGPVVPSKEPLHKTESTKFTKILSGSHMHKVEKRDKSYAFRDLHDYDVSRYESIDPSCTYSALDDPTPTPTITTNTNTQTVTNTNATSPSIFPSPTFLSTSNQKTFETLETIDSTSIQSDKFIKSEDSLIANTEQATFNTTNALYIEIDENIRKMANNSDKIDLAYSTSTEVKLARQLEKQRQNLRENSADHVQTLKSDSLIYDTMADTVSASLTQDILSQPNLTRNNNQAKKISYNPSKYDDTVAKISKEHNKNTSVETSERDSFYMEILEDDKTKDSIGIIPASKPVKIAETLKISHDVKNLWSQPQYQSISTSKSNTKNTTFTSDLSSKENYQVPSSFRESKNSISKSDSNKNCSEHQSIPSSFKNSSVEPEPFVAEKIEKVSTNPKDQPKTIVEKFYYPKSKKTDEDQKRAEKLPEPIDDQDFHLKVKFNKTTITDPSNDLNYQLNRTLGEGTFGKVYKTTCLETKDILAIKVIKSEQRYVDSARLEIKVLEKINQLDVRNRFHCIELMDHFECLGHPCLIFPILGKSTYDFQKTNDYRPFKFSQIRVMSFQLLQAVNFLHKTCKLTHTDLKPENILFIDDSYDEITSPNSGKTLKLVRKCDIKLIDFGSATFEYEQKTKIVATRHYRPPEVILELGWSYPLDIWSIGCIIFEWYMGLCMFQTHSNIEHLAMMEKILGIFPDRIIERSRRAYKFFKERESSDLQSSLSAQELCNQNPSNDKHQSNYQVDFNFNSSEAKYVRDNCRPLYQYNQMKSDYEHRNMFHLIRVMLDYDAKRRITCEEALSHRFFKPLEKDRPYIRSSAEIKKTARTLGETNHKTETITKPQQTNQQTLADFIKQETANRLHQKFSQRTKIKMTNGRVAQIGQGSWSRKDGKWQMVF